MAEKLHRFREIHFNPFNKNRAIIRDYIDGVTQCYLINTKGELIHKFEPNVWVDNIEDDNVIFASCDIDNRKNGEALFDINGNQLTDFKYQGIYHGVEEGFFEVENTDGEHGQLSITGEEVVPCIYEDSCRFQEGVSAMKLNNKWGMVDYKNSTIIPFIYEDMFCSFNNKIPAKLNGKWGIVDKFNKKIIDFKFDEIGFYIHRDCLTFPAKLDDKWGIIDIYGQTVFDFVYDDCDSLDKAGWYKFKKNDKWAIYSCEKNEFVSDFIYDNIDLYASGICQVKLGDKYDYIDYFNRPIADFKYEHINHFYKTNLVAFSENNKFGLMNTGGKIIIPAKLDDKIKYADENMLVMEDDNFNQYVMDINENIIIPKQKYQRFWGGYSCGFITLKDRAYYDTKGQELKLKFEL